ncbi:MAG: ImmA/IrrE family metallo-endopeptidase [Bacillota bacterium]|jgi:Zn-dependent peptidase ImmA (M78 family)
MITTLLDLYNEAEDKYIDVDYFPTRSLVSFSTAENLIAIDVDKLESTREEKVCLAHEMGHCITGSFYNIYSKFDIRQKHENRADRWAIKRLVPLEQLIEAVKTGITETWDLAEYFEVTEQFITKAIEYYKDIIN